MFRRTLGLALLALCTACGANVVFGPPGEDGGLTADGGAPSQVTSTSAMDTVTSTSTGGMQPYDVLDQLNDVPGLSVAELPSDYPGYRWFVGTFMQLADHEDPNGLKFPQRIYILHKDVSAPTVLVSTGYTLWEADYLSEPALFTEGNQISIEHRFFPPSRPEPANWQLLTIEQAARDHHAIVDALKPIYSARWLSTGASKGGMTSMYHRRFFPKDVDGTIPYVAPLSYGLGDARYATFLDQVGTQECRDALKAYQVEILSRRASMVDYVASSGASFSYWGYDASLDFAVEGLRFALWQYGDESLCGVPNLNASDDELFNYLENVSSVVGVSDEWLDFFEPYYFQAAIQLGDPGQDESYMAPYLSIPVGMSAGAFVHPGPTKEMVFRPESMPDIQTWTTGEGSELLFVYGANDPWSAGAFEVSGVNDTYRFFAVGANHGAGISMLDPSDGSVAQDAILRWAGLLDSAGGGASPPQPSPVHLELARLARLIDSTPVRQRREAFDHEARALIARER